MFNYDRIMEPPVIVHQQVGFLLSGKERKKERKPSSGQTLPINLARFHIEYYHCFFQVYSVNSGPAVAVSTQRHD